MVISGLLGVIMISEAYLEPLLLQVSDVSGFWIVVGYGGPQNVMDNTGWDILLLLEWVLLVSISLEFWGW